MTKCCKSDALSAVHETALGLLDAGVMPQRTMDVFDELCLVLVEELSAEQIREIEFRRTQVRQFSPCI